LAETVALDSIAFVCHGNCSIALVFRGVRYPSSAFTAQDPDRFVTTPLNAISTSDGRYNEKAAELRPLIRERGLIR
ncbi:hypothetical protein, partial [Salmonella enterica]|uniref:hypothetical protein n=1 Tax=Salmonella enterica TaxID=28901 RepID=UPI003296BC9A